MYEFDETIRFIRENSNNIYQADCAVYQYHPEGLAGSEDAWRAAASSEPDSPYAIAAGNLLHPDYARGIPIFVTTVPLPAELDTLIADERPDVVIEELVERTLHAPLAFPM